MQVLNLGHSLSPSSGASYQLCRMLPSVAHTLSRPCRPSEDMSNKYISSADRRRLLHASRHYCGFLTQCDGCFVRTIRHANSLRKSHSTRNYQEALGARHPSPDKIRPHWRQAVRQQWAMLGEGSEGWIMQGNNKRMGVTKIRWPHRYEESRAQRSSDTVGAPPASELRRTCKKRINNTRRLPTCAHIPSTTRGTDAASVFSGR